MKVRHEDLTATVLLVLATSAAAWSCGRSPIDAFGGPDLLGPGAGGVAGSSGNRAGSPGGSGDGGKCAPGALLCDGLCTLADFDPANCGACGNVCPEGELCSLGTCGLICTGGTAKCGERCVDPALDPANCGGCDVVCVAGQVCSGGLCGAACAGALTACDGVCVDLALDPQHCGSCGVACADFELCSAGACGATCVGGTTQCGDVCVDAQNDPAHCGNCSTVCAEGLVCSLGQCSGACNGGTTQCGDRCVDTSVDPNHCGACDAKCDGGEVCSQGGCASVCGGELTKCGNECVDTGTDPAHCGSCGAPCGPGQNCVEGQCQDCDSTSEDCDRDGWFVADGDCCDKPSACGSDPSLVNPGALEVLGNGADDDCNGKVDLFDAETLQQCDADIPSDSSDPFDYARALGVCRRTEESPAEPGQRTWGLIDAKLLRANGSALGDARARSIRGVFGNIAAVQGTRMAVLSTGVAADASQTNPGPNGGAPSGFSISSSHAPASTVDIASCSAPHCVDDWFATANPPLKDANRLPQAPGCGSNSAASLANDSVMLVLRMRAPTNVRAFSFNSYFLSAEYPEFVCSTFNDQFVALVDTPAGEPAPIPNPVDKNLLVFTQGGVQWPIGINVAKGTSLFSVCAPEAGNPCWSSNVDAASCSLGTAELVGTGFEAPTSTDPHCTIGGGTHWLTTAGNVVPGTIVELRIVIWDVGDPFLDSTALIDGFQWLPSATLPGTN